jgi:hypothetical protein
LTNSGRGRENYLYHATCGPHYLISKEKFSEIAARLAEEGFLEVMSGTRQDTLWLVRKDYVDQTILDGVTN